MITRITSLMPLSLAILLMAIATPASAQYYGWGGGYHASTAGESYARGAADLVRSAGAANLMNAQAATELESARSEYLDNRAKATNTYFQMRQANREYRALENPRPSSSQLFRIAEEAVPDQLSSTELDPLTGQINWPVALTDETYAPVTQQIDELVAHRARTGGRLSYSDTRQLQGLISGLEASLKENIRNYPPQTYTTAKSFLQSLAYQLDRSSA